MANINPQLQDTGTPPIPEAKAWLSAYKGQVGPIIDLSQAAPGGAPPQLLMQALQKAAADPATARYGPIRGEDSLREAYASEMSRVYGTPLTSSQSVVVSGCNQAFLMAVITMAKAGDEIILPTPWYFNHKMALDMLGIRAVPLPGHPENGFVPTVADAEALVTAKTRALVLVTPNNPTGAIYPPATIAAFSAFAEAAGIWLVLDETYRDFLPAKQVQPHGLLQTAGGMPNHLIQLYSFSKAYAIPGYRLGAITAPDKMMPDLAKVLDTVQICPPRIGQIAVAETMAALLDWREESRAVIESRASRFAEVMRELNDWHIGSIGAYFAYVRPPGPSGSAAETAQNLAVNKGVLALPGQYFGPGQEDWLRIAFANATPEQLSDLPQRLR
ncbi:MAG: aminotransferase [Beijerinckiaceae bacterium]